MKGKLITLGILSLVKAICLIMVIVALLKVAEDGHLHAGDHQEHRRSLYAQVGIPYIFMWISIIATFILGIVTLATQKHPKARGLTIAAGILGMIGDLFGTNAIVSFIAVYKIKKSESEEYKTDAWATKDKE